MLNFNFIVIIVFIVSKIFQYTFISLLVMQRSVNKSFKIKVIHKSIESKAVVFIRHHKIFFFEDIF